jgi:cytoskeleton protein RodZ
MSAQVAGAGSFGESLKLCREEQSISLQQIADRTKLSKITLEALERDDLSRLPGGIYTRGVIRSYASEIGLDPEKAVQHFIKQFPHDWAMDARFEARQAGNALVVVDRTAIVLAVILLAVAVVSAWLVWG